MIRVISKKKKNAAKVRHRVSKFKLVLSQYFFTFFKPGNIKFSETSIGIGTENRSTY